MGTDIQKTRNEMNPELDAETSEKEAAGSTPDETKPEAPGFNSETNAKPEVEVPDPRGEAGRLMNEIQKQILMITEAQDRNDQDMKQIHRDFYQFMQIQDKMQEELEKHRGGLFQQLLDPVLKTIGRIYNDNIVNVEKIEDVKLRKNFSCLFDELEQILIENSVEVYVSESGKPFSPKYCRVKNKIPTSDKGLHGTVIKSYSKGFHIGPRILAPENVDVYVFDSSTGKER
jgi:molecular chaperone GrpE (heat shock protein)